MTTSGGVTLVRYENLVMYEALSRARACCRCVCPNSVMALRAGLTSSMTFGTCAAWNSGDFEIGDPRSFIPAVVVLIMDRAGSFDPGGFGSPPVYCT